MRKLRCTSCGAELKLDDNKEYATCEHCGSKYKLNDDLNINIKVDDNVKEMVDKGAKRFSKFALISIILFVLIVVAGIVFVIKPQIDANKEREKRFDEEVSKKDFNFNFISVTGTKNGFFIERILDDINESNKKHDRKVTLVFNGNSTTDETEIINYKHGLNNKDTYEVSVNYDSDGYVYEIRVDKID